MIIYRVENGKGMGPFTGSSDVGSSSLWNAGPTPREDGLEGMMAGRVCGVADPYLLTRWFPYPHVLRAYGFMLTLWEAPDGVWLKHQALFDRDSATLLHTIELPDLWDEFDLVSLLRDVNPTER